MALSQIQLEAFQAVAKAGSFTAAAAVLHLTQSALSHRIRNLETELGTSLFVRHGSGARLTEVGTRLLQFCRVQSQAEEEFLQEVLSKPQSQDLSGTLRIGGVSTLVRSAVVPAIAKLLRKSPDVRLELFSRELRDLPRLLKSAQADFVITCGAISAPGLQEELLGHEEYVLVESAKKNIITDVLLDHDSEDQTTYDFFKLNGKKNALLKRSFMDDIYGILDGVAAGLGRAVVPLHLVTDRKDIKMISGYKPMKLPVFLYQLRQPYYTRLHSAFLGEMLSNIPGQLRTVNS